MPDHCSQGSADSILPSMLNSALALLGYVNPIAGVEGSWNVTGPESISSKTSERSTLVMDRSTSCMEDTHASPSRLLALRREGLTPAISGQSSLGVFAYYDPASSSLKTSQGILFSDSMAYSLNLPPWGMTQDGVAYELATPGRPIAVSDSSSLLPTPTAGDSKQSGSRNLPGSAAKPGVSLTDLFLRGGSTTGRLLKGSQAHGMLFTGGNTKQPSELGNPYEETLYLGQLTIEGA